MEPADKIAAVHKYVDAFAKSSIDLIRNLFAEDAVVEDPIGTEPHRGIEAIVAFYEKGFSMGITLELTGTPRCSGNAVAFPFRVVGEGITIEIIDVFEFNDTGKVEQMRAYWGPENYIKV